MKITFVYHTCYCAEDESMAFIFDYWKGKLPVFPKEKPVYVFASHSHHDHFNRGIYKLSEKYDKVYYIFSEDIRPVLPDAFKNSGCHITWLKAGESKTVGDIFVRAYFSTDEGVAFLVKAKQRTMMHFGDLNWWHWEDEDDAFNRWQREKFQEEIEKLKDEHIDISFGPALDARQKPYHWLGMDYFLRHVHADKVFPIHFFDEIGLVKQFILSDKAKAYRDKIVCVEKENQEFLI